MKKQLVTFLDNAQRTIIGELEADNGTTRVVKNPVVVNIVPQLAPNGAPTGQMSLQLLPLFFKEFQGDKRADVFYTYQASSIVPITFEGGFDFRLEGQYSSIFSNTPMVAQPPAAAPTQTPGGAPVIKLFDDA